MRINGSATWEEDEKGNLKTTVKILSSGLSVGPESEIRCAECGVKAQTHRQQIKKICSTYRDSRARVVALMMAPARVRGWRATAIGSYNFVEDDAFLTSSFLLVENSYPRLRSRNHHFERHLSVSFALRVDA